MTSLALEIWPAPSPESYAKYYTSSFSLRVVSAQLYTCSQWYQVPSISSVSRQSLFLDSTFL